MGGHSLLEGLLWAKVYVAEVCGTAVFIVFVAVETFRAIRGILELGRKDK
jgi:hypothetical protein